MNKLRKGDEIILISGKDKGRRGTITSTLGDCYFLVDNLNLAKKAVKPNPSKNDIGGFSDKPLPIHGSNIALFNPNENKAGKIKIIQEGTKRVRVFKSDNSKVGS